MLVTFESIAAPDAVGEFDIKTAVLGLGLGLGLVRGVFLLGEDATLTTPSLQRLLPSRGGQWIRPWHWYYGSCISWWPWIKRRGFLGCLVFGNGVGHVGVELS